MRINHDIRERLLTALVSARGLIDLDSEEECTIPRADKERVRVFVETWIVEPLAVAFREIDKPRPPPNPLRYRRRRP